MSADRFLPRPRNVCACRSEEERNNVAVSGDLTVNRDWKTNAVWFVIAAVAGYFGHSYSTSLVILGFYAVSREIQVATYNLAVAFDRAFESLQQQIVEEIRGTRRAVREMDDRFWNVADDIERALRLKEALEIQSQVVKVLENLDSEIASIRATVEALSAQVEQIESNVGDLHERFAPNEDDDWPP